MSCEQQAEDRKEMPTRFDMVLPWPVSSNSLHAPWNGGMVLTAEARQYYWAMKELLQREWGLPPMLGRLKAEVWIHESDLRARDINNYTKSLFDALEGAGIFENDSQIDQTMLYRGELKESPCVRVILTILPEGPPRVPVKVKREADMKKDQEDKRRQQQRRTLTKSFGKVAVDELQVFKVPEPTANLARRLKTWPAGKPNGK